MRHGLIAGHNVDRVDIESGMREFAAIGYSDPHSAEVVRYALQRWARGEEEQATRGAIDRSFHGIDLTGWYRILAASLANAADAAPPDVADNPPIVFPPSFESQS